MKLIRSKLSVADFLEDLNLISLSLFPIAVNKKRKHHKNANQMTFATQTVS
jgi:phosphoserine phosphatase